jgi:hypothetical protein
VYTLQFGSVGPGTIGFALTGGPSYGTYYLAISFAAGNFPNGWLYGIDILLPDLVGQINAGYPFVGGLDFCGGTVFGPVTGLPSGFAIWSVGLGCNGPLGLPAAVTAPTAFVIP